MLTGGTKLEDILIQTYDNYAGVDKQGNIVMQPLSNASITADIDVTISQDGEFIEASFLNGKEDTEEDKKGTKKKSKKEKVDTSTITPVTEKSQSRTGNFDAHALNDRIMYVSKDFLNYWAPKNDKTKKYIVEAQDEYLDNLENWVNSEFSHPKAEAVYRYVSKGKLTADLISCGLLKLEPDGKLPKSANGTDYYKLIVRFLVQDGLKKPEPTWEDVSLMEAYSEYYSHYWPGKTGICMVTGEEGPITYLNPKGVLPLPGCGNAKLISSNDNQEFTYRGTHKNQEQAFTISQEASQKMHIALKYLAKNRAFSRGKSAYLLWCPNKNVAFVSGGNDILTESDDSDTDTEEEINGILTDEFDDYADETSSAGDETSSTGEVIVEVPIDYSQNLRNALSGFRNQFSRDDEVVYAELYCAVPGRLAAPCYSIYAADDFLARIERWNETCCWYQRMKNNTGDYYYRTVTPSPTAIILAAYGDEKKKTPQELEAEERKRKSKNYKGPKRERDLTVRDEVLSRNMETLMKCILGERQLPYDIVLAAARSASSLKSYRGPKQGIPSNRGFILRTACAVIAKFYSDQGVKITMTLDENCRDRSYLFGRILAIYDKVESSVNYKQGHWRDTKAILLQNDFVYSPKSTWKELNERTEPYFRKLSKGSEIYYRRQIKKVKELFLKEDDDEMDERLTEVYLLGYSDQMKAMNNSYKKKESSD